MFIRFYKFIPAIAFLLSLSAAHAVTELPKLLQPGIPASPISASSHDGIVFRIVVPEGAKNLTVTTSGGRGDCDLFVRAGAHPTESNYNSASVHETNAERIVIPAPVAGNWYILLDADRPFSGVRLIARYQRTKSTLPVPILTPAPGTYSELAAVSARSTIAGSKVRYTTDGNDPTEASPVFPRPLKLTTDTDLRVRAYTRAHVAGPVLQADYYVNPPGTITTLTNGNAFTHRAGTHGYNALYKITVPAGKTKLNVQTSGDIGNSEIFLRYGEAPVGKFFDKRSNKFRNRAEITVENPEAGDWYVLLRARTNFSQCNIVASYAGTKPDLTVWADVLKPYLSVETYVAGDCTVDEGFLTAGTHRLLRFTTETRNVGGVDLLMPPLRDSENNLNPLYEYHPCHGHYHFLGYARYRLLDENGDTAATGSKVSFCLEDVRPWSATAPVQSKYNCGFQGLQVGWADIYDSGLPGQWIDVTGVAPGSYTLEVTVNPDHILDEDDYTNNTATVPVVITAP